MAKGKKKAGKPAAAKAPTRRAAAPASAAPKTAASTAVLDELLKVTGQEAPKKGESLPDFVLRVATAMAEVPDDKFTKLSPEARKWYDENSAFYNDEKLDKLYPLGGMPGYVEQASAPAEAAAPAAAAAATEPSPASTSAQQAQQEPPQSTQETDMAKKAAGKKTGKKTTNGSGAERSLRTDSTSYQVRLAVVKNPDIAFEKLCEKVGVKGKAASPTGHVHNMFQHAKIVMKIAAAEGYKAK